ncbi:hypothetical protein GOPIP_001_00440 [Gordonia polyisoprenivorans NBRC 16320 = JCM 10675]|nr:hypothetical protein GOPIP_001_00440 [Gordonia polyisoprenivorans NBRC 16320 = JCM 10675]
MIEIRCVDVFSGDGRAAEQRDESVDVEGVGGTATIGPAQTLQHGGRQMEPVHRQISDRVVAEPLGEVGDDAAGDGGLARARGPGEAGHESWCVRGRLDDLRRRRHVPRL